MRRFVFEGPTIFMLFLVAGFLLLSCILNPFWFQTKLGQFAKRDAKRKRLAAKRRERAEKEQSGETAASAGQHSLEGAATRGAAQAVETVAADKKAH